MSINHLNSPPPVQRMEVAALKTRLEQGTISVIDIRPAQDRARAAFPLAHVLDEASATRLLALPKDTPLAFLCHHGISSRSAVEYFRAQGFQQVFNVEGGIDAWSSEIDTVIPRY